MVTIREEVCLHDGKRGLISGEVADNFGEVAEEFCRNFADRGEPGAACDAHRGRATLFDPWGGIADASSEAPWRRDTLVPIASATKGVAAMVVALAHSRAGSTTTTTSRRTGPTSGGPARSASPAASCSTIKPACARWTNRSTSQQPAIRMPRGRYSACR